MESIAGQVAVVTGAGRGIGRAVAIRLASLGARVVIGARTLAELEETARLTGGAVVVQTDVRRRGDVENLLDAAAPIGPVDILVNCAGIGMFGPVARFTDEQFEDVMQTNLSGIFYSCRHVLGSMTARGTGHIINVASIAGRVGSANRAVYCASKFAVVGFSEALAEEVRSDGVRVSVICPGSTNTRFSSSPESKAADRLLQPEDVAHVVEMLVTQKANSFISEVVLRPTRRP